MRAFRGLPGSQGSEPEQPGDAVGSGIVMRRLIRSKATRAYLTMDGAWTQNIADAALFADYAAAAAAKRRFELGEVELYYSFYELRESEWDFGLTLQ